MREFGLPLAEAYDDLVARIRSGEAGSTAPEPGEPMPEFLLPDSSGRLVSLEDVIAEGPTVISFNRGHWCEYCRIELTAFRQGMNENAAHEASVVSMMPELEVFTGSAPNACNAFKILSDIDNGYALTMLPSWLGDACATSNCRTASILSASEFAIGTDQQTFFHEFCEIDAFAVGERVLGADGERESLSEERPGVRGGPSSRRADPPPRSPPRPSSTSRRSARACRAESAAPVP